MMLCESISPEGEATGYTVLALDAVDAGVGDTVLNRPGRLERFQQPRPEKPGAAIDSAIIGVVDRIDLLESPSA